MFETTLLMISHSENDHKKQMQISFFRQKYTALADNIYGYQRF